MQIVQVTYQRSQMLDDGEQVTIGARAVVDRGEHPEAVFRRLRAWVHEKLEHEAPYGLSRHPVMASPIVERSPLVEIDERDVAKVVRLLLRRGGRLDHRTVLRHSHLRARQLRQVVAVLRDAGVLVEEREGEGRSERRWYRLLQSPSLDSFSRFFDR